MDGALLSAFIAFAEERNFTRAARRVGLSQPALFERVQRLQAALPQPLYQREGRGLVLTEAGVRLLAHARESAERAALLLRELGGQGPASVVTLAAGEGSYLYLLGAALRRFVAEGGALRPLTLGAPDACAALRAGQAHLAVCALDLCPDDLQAVALVRTPLCVALRADHPLAARRKVPLAALARERLILAPAGQRHRDIVGRALAPLLTAPLCEPLEADGWPLMLRFAELGLGVAFVNGTCALPAGVVARPVPELGGVTYYLLRRSGALLPAAAERLARVIGEEVSAPG